MFPSRLTSRCMLRSLQRVQHGRNMSAVVLAMVRNEELFQKNSTNTIKGSSSSCTMNKRQGKHLSCTRRKHSSVNYNKQPWQATSSSSSGDTMMNDNNHIIQGVTQQEESMVRGERTMQQQKITTIETIIPWFVENMPQSYFQQVTEKLQMDHIQAIAARKAANKDFHMNLQSFTSDGRLVLTFIRPTTTCHDTMDVLLKIMKELPNTIDGKDYIPLSRAQVFSTADGTMSLNVFVLGEERQGKTLEEVETLGSAILEYSRTATTMHHRTTTDHGVVVGPDYCDFSAQQQPSVPPPPPMDKEHLIQYFYKCSRAYIGKTPPFQFLRQRELFALVSGSEEGTTAVAMEDDPPVPDRRDDYEANGYCSTTTGDRTNNSTNATAAAASTTTATTTTSVVAASDEDCSSSSSFWIHVAIVHSIPQIALENTLRVLAYHDISVMTAHLDLISSADNADAHNDGHVGTVTMLRIHATPVAKGIQPSDEMFVTLFKEIQHCQWLDPQTIDLAFDACQVA